MSKRSQRPGREELKAKRKEKKKQEKILRAQLIAAGHVLPPSPAKPNTVSQLTRPEEERALRAEAVCKHMQIIRAQLPTLLKRLSKIPDPREPKKIKHGLTTLMLYGALVFVLQFSSRREANEEMTMPTFMQNLQAIFPELSSIPHADTLYRLLERIDPGKIEEAHIALIHRLIRKKKFYRYLIKNCFPISLDGTQKSRLDYLWDSEALERTVGKGETGGTSKQYYVYVLESCLCFKNGMVIPLMTEFLEYTQGDSEREKQDCELRAFHRLTTRIKKIFPRLKIMLLLDGLYACGPVMQSCHERGWMYMIVLKDKDLPSIWEEVNHLLPLQSDNVHARLEGERRQSFWWVNDIDYVYGGNKHIAVHVVGCEEAWETVTQNAEIITENSRHVWISSLPLDKGNVDELCNFGARHRWGIEANINVEKHQGYYYEHRFSYNWNAMKASHYLMRLAHTLNTLCRYAEQLVRLFREKGVQGFLAFVKSSCAAPWLPSADELQKVFGKKFQLRLV